MSKQLQEMLQELKNRGNTVLGDEVAAFLEATDNNNPNTSPVCANARKMLAQAARSLREGKTKEDVAIAHDFLGASIEVYREEKAGVTPSIPSAVTASLGQELAAEHAFRNVEKVVIEGDSPEFNNAPEVLVTALANLLLDGGYVDEARRYLTEYNLMIDERNTNVKSTKETLKELQAQYRKSGDLVRARALEEVIGDLDEDMEDDVEGNEADSKLALEDENKAEDEGEDEAKAGDDKPVLQVDPASDEEVEEKEKAEGALSLGDIKSAKRHLTKASKMERMRLTAALIRHGDMELAMAGIVEAEGEEDDISSEEKAGGYCKPDDKECEDEAKGEGEGDEDDMVSHDHDEKPTEDETAKRDTEAKEAESAVPHAPYKDDADEKEVASAIARHIRKAVRAGKMVQAKDGLKDLDKLEQAVVAGVKKAEVEIKDMALAREGYKIWKEIRAMNLKAIKLVAEEEGDDEKADQASDGLEKLKKENDGEEGHEVSDVPPIANDDMPNVKEGDDLGDSLDSEPSEDEPK